MPRDREKLIVKFPVAGNFFLVQIPKGVPGGKVRVGIERDKIAQGTIQHDNMLRWRFFCLPRLNIRLETENFMYRGQDRNQMF